LLNFLASALDIFNPPEDQWNDSGAAAAYKDMQTAWSMETRENAKASFSNFMGNYFHTRPTT